MTSGTTACTVNYNQTGNSNYSAATEVTSTTTAVLATQSALTFTGQTVTSPTTFSTLSTTGGSGTGAVTYVVTTAGTAGCSISGTTLSYTTAGTCGVTATKAADSNYNAVSSSEVTFSVGSAPVVTSPVVVSSGGGNGPIVGGGGVYLPGQTKPRQQIIYPDGHIVYLDTVTPNTPNATTTTSTKNTNMMTPTTTYTFTHNISLHDTGTDVKSLQQFLNSHGFVISKTGAGSPGKETTLFGSLTYKALQKFQKSIGLPATGFFGPLTRAYISKH